MYLLMLTPLQADTLTAPELQQCKEALRTSLAIPQGASLLLMHPQQPGLLDEAFRSVGLVGSQLEGPLAVVCGTELDPALGRQGLNYVKGSFHFPFLSFLFLNLYMYRFKIDMYSR